MSQKFNPFPSVRRDRQRQLAREQDPDTTPHASPPPVRPQLPSRTSTEQTIRSSTLSSPISPGKGGLYNPSHSNEPTTVRSSGLSSTDDEAFELYLAKQKELAAMRAQQSKPAEDSVADQEAREFEAIAEGSESDAEELLMQNGQDAEGMDEEIELGHMQEIVPGLWIGDVVAARDGEALQEAGIVRLRKRYLDDADISPPL
jgi:dual specificity phosphatase 12